MGYFGLLWLIVDTIHWHLWEVYSDNVKYKSFVWFMMLGNGRRHKKTDEMLEMRMLTC